jgi:hypothetical protein
MSCSPNRGSRANVRTAALIFSSVQPAGRGGGRQIVDEIVHDSAGDRIAEQRAFEERLQVVPASHKPVGIGDGLESSLRALLRSLHLPNRECRAMFL